MIPNLKIGDYKITVIPKTDAKPTDTYTLKLSAGDTSIILAESISISDIPDQPYIIRSTEGGHFSNHNSYNRLRSWHIKPKE